MVCAAHATQHVAARAALACNVCRHDLDAIAKVALASRQEAQLPGKMEIRHTQVMGKRQHLKVG